MLNKFSDSFELIIIPIGFVVFHVLKLQWNESNIWSVYIVLKKADKSQIQELEKHVESVTKEKQRLQCLVESVQRRAEELERTNEIATQQAETWKSEAQCVPELQTQCSTSQAKIECLEKESQGLQRELAKLRESVEVRIN
jgi:predicted RNase H-like nuclease (RuvC/YqgF family)